MNSVNADFLPHKKNSAIQISTLVIVWSAIFIIIFCCAKINNLYFSLLGIILIGVLQHYLLVLLHESVHQVFFINKSIHDYLSDMFIALPCVMFTKYYRDFHLKHHAYLGTKDDPENEMKKYPKWTFPKKNILQLVISYFSIVGEQSLPVRLKRIYTVYFDSRNKVSYKIFTGSYYFLVISLIYTTGFFQIFIIYWLAPLFLILPFLLRIRNLAEHIGILNKSKYNHTRDVKGNFLEVILLVPLNANYHLTHHLYPKTPWYNLKKANAAIRKNEVNYYIYSSYLGCTNSVLDELHL